MSAEHELKVSFDQLGRLQELLGQAAGGRLGLTFENPRLVKCWEEKNCHQTKCPAYQSQNLRCWQVAGTFCGGEVQGSFAQKLGNCAECEVFRKSCWSDPITAVGENFNNMMLLLERESRQLRALNNLLRQLLEEKQVLEEAHERLGERIKDITTELGRTQFPK